jgi:hypothetical protein
MARLDWYREVGFSEVMAADRFHTRRDGIREKPSKMDSKLKDTKLDPEGTEKAQNTRLMGS